MSDRLNRNNNLEHLKDSFAKIDLRLSDKLRAKETTISYFESICKYEKELENDFSIFFPQLCEHVRNHVDTNKLSHWNIKPLH